jgi:hypothetical protein
MILSNFLRGALARGVGMKATLSLVALVLASFPSVALARADLRLEGDWSSDRPVSLDTSATPRSRAIELLADAAGWSVVQSAPLGDPVDLHVRDEPASKVLALLLPDGAYVARRSGNLVSILPGTPAVAAPHGRGDDRSVFGGELTIEKDEIVHDVAVFGGRLDVYGTVTGNLAVIGGMAEVHDGARVQGSATVMGGEIRLDDGAVVEHDVDVVGGHVDRAERAKVLGSVGDDDHADKSRARWLAKGGSRGPAHAWHGLRAWGDDAAGSVSLAALLFVFGTVVIALATDRSRTLRVEIAARPMRTFALGVVGCVVATTVLAALCVTIVGIPVAVVAALALVLITYAGVTAALTTAGEALLRHRTTSSYAHLGLGCLIYFFIGLFPWVGFWVHVAVGLVGIGAIVATRGAGFVPLRPRRGATLASGDPSY